MFVPAGDFDRVGRRQDERHAAPLTGLEQAELLPSLRLSGCVSRSRIGEETDAGSGQRSGERGVESSFHSGGTVGPSLGVGQPLRRVSDLPQRNRQWVGGEKDVECARVPQRRPRLLDRIRKRCHRSGAGPPDLDNPCRDPPRLRGAGEGRRAGRRRAGRRQDRWLTSRRPAPHT